MLLFCVGVGHGKSPDNQGRLHDWIYQLGDYRFPHHSFCFSLEKFHLKSDMLSCTVF